MGPYDRFDIVANAPNDVTKTQESPSLQALLAERFKLVAHRETQDFPVYALVLARPDRSLGPQLTLSQIDCSQRDAIRARAFGGVVPAGAGAPANCSTSSSDGRMAGNGVTLEEFARNLPVHLGFVPRRTLFDSALLDRTGLRAGSTSVWNGAGHGRRVPAACVRPRSRRRRSFSRRWSSSSASRSSLSSRQAPVLVIDSIEPPTEN